MMNNRFLDPPPESILIQARLMRFQILEKIRMYVDQKDASSFDTSSIAIPAGPARRGFTTASGSKIESLLMELRNAVYAYKKNTQELSQLDTQISNARVAFLTNEDDSLSKEIERKVLLLQKQEEDLITLIQRIENESVREEKYRIDVFAEDWETIIDKQNMENMAALAVVQKK